MVTAGTRCRVYTPPSKAFEWRPSVVHVDGKLKSVSADNPPSNVYDETWVIKNGHLVRG